MNLENLTYESFRSLLIERFNKPKMTLIEYRTIHQEAHEKVTDYIRRMDNLGKINQHPAEVRMDAIKNGIRRFRDVMRNKMAGVKEINQNLIETLVEIEVLEAEKERRNFKQKPQCDNRPKTEKSKRNTICFRCGAEGHIAPDCKVKGNATNEIIDNSEILNKSDFIYIDKVKIKPIIDTGAEGNYITTSLVDQLQLKIMKVEKPRIRYTCLGDPFQINSQVLLNYEYEGKEYSVNCDVLPKRLDRVLLLGNEWIRKIINKQTPVIQKNLTEKELHKRLFEGRKEGITGNYECFINTEEGSCVTEGPTLIPQALQSKMVDTVETLLQQERISESTSNWSNKVRPVMQEDGSIRLTTNLIKLNQLVPLDKYSLPRIDTMLTSLRDFEYFSKIDLKDGFFQIPLRIEDRYKTAFMVNNKLYEWNRMPMGFKNAPAIFQRFMDKILKEEIGKGV